MPGVKNTNLVSREIVTTALARECALLFAASSNSGASKKLDFRAEVALDSPRNVEIRQTETRKDLKFS